MTKKHDWQYHRFEVLDQMLKEDGFGEYDHTADGFRNQEPNDVIESEIVYHLTMAHALLKLKVESRRKVHIDNPPRGCMEDYERNLRRKIYGEE